MGWGWHFSSGASAKDGSDTPAFSAASTAASPRDEEQERRRRDLDLQRYQLELLRLEKEELNRLIKLRQQEEARQAPQISSPPQVMQPPLPHEPPRTREDNFRRGAKQLGLFFAGAGFLTASALISRRAVARKMVDAYPKFYQPSHHGPRPPPRARAEKGEDQLVAIEALGLATLNVFSFGVMMTGGVMFAFDISNVEDLRRKARSKLYGTNGVVDEAAEQQVEEWIADVLSKRDKREDAPNSRDKSS